MICTKIGTGATPRGGSEVYLKARINHALVRSQHVFDRHFDTAGLAFISDFDANGLRNAEIQSGDVLLNITGDGVTFGRSCIVPDRILPACVNQHVAIIRPDRSECDPGYLLSVLTHPATKSYIESFNSGGSRRAITKGHIESFEIPLPPLPIQKRIAHILGTLDDKIELNRRMNGTLEAMARALFRSWFVDFDPVRAKMDGRQPPGMDPATAELFPDSFDHEGSGIVPKGWARKRWGDIVTLEYGKTLRGYRENKGGYRVFGTNGPIGFNDEPLCPTAGIVIGRKGAYRGVHFSPDPFFVIDTAFYLKPTAVLDLKWAYYELVRLDINSMDSGSAIPSTSREDFYGIPVFVPPPQIQKSFGEIVDRWFAQMFANDHQSHTHAALRDTLLPKLLSGELSVAETPDLLQTAS
ncbi:restriction endonuclease subunit S [Haloferula sp. A504]|uniref:restriction endonuclease subunit S n=1 Tax=Haloferula sp. A504 TaxID=3373601 RepID=UPI0031C623CD|nr:restriction endonuclease subunit S [Verrucomicrobiaceae bacterium E54]